MMRLNKMTLVVVAAAAMTACGDNGDTSASGTDSATGTGTVTTPTTGTSTPTSTGTVSATGSESGGSGSASETMGTTPTTGDATTSTTTNATTDATTTLATSTGQVSASDTGSSGSDTGVLDTGVVPCGEPGEPEFSYIWIANSTQGTVSKIDTQTLKEVGRYLVRADALGDPSRTSVSITGDVAVANRSGGFTKVHARLVDCVESNGMPGIQTATDANFLPWDVEECRAWHTPMAYESQRPAAWSLGTFNENTCTYENQKVWTAGANNNQGVPGVTIHRVDGDTGAIEATIPIPDIQGGFYGIYGAATDPKGNFWGSQLGIGHLVFVDAETLEVKKWPMAGGGYGMTVGKSGYVWTCSSEVSRFDPMTETWQVANVNGSGGCMEDDNGTLYMSGGLTNIVAVDVETLAVKNTYPVPNYVHGISIDFYGYVWGVTLFQPFAYRVDPKDGTFQTFTGLVNPYTYSDMTGVALSNVAPQ